MIFILSVVQGGRPFSKEEVVGGAAAVVVGAGVEAVAALAVGVADSVMAGAVVGTDGLPLADGLDAEHAAAKTSVDPTNA